MSKSRPHPEVLLTIASVLMAFAQFSCAGLPGSRTLRESSSVVVQNSFGFDIHNAAQNWPGMSFGYWRLWDANVDWARVEPMRGIYDFSLLDQYIALAQQHGVKIVYVLGNTPTWTSTDPMTIGTELVPGATAPPSNMSDWQSFVETVAKRYRGRIQGYEIWNEANLQGYWEGDLPTMLQLTKTAYTLIKAIDPAAIVLAPSVVAHDGLQYLSDFLSAGGANYTDVVPYHLYDTAKSPEDAVQFYNEVLGIAQQWGKDVWDTEVGWGPWGSFDDAGAAAFLARTFILQCSVGVTHIIWYAWDDRGPWVHLFLVQSDLHTPTLAALAFGQVQSWLQGTSVSCTNDADGVWQCTLATTVGKAKYVVWDATGTSTFSVPSSWAVTHLRDLQGNVSKLPKSLAIGPSPVLLEP